MSLIDEVARLLKEKDWNFHVNKERSFIIMKVGDKECQHPVEIQVKEEQQVIIGMLTYERKVDPEYREDMIRFMNKANFDFNMGGFEMDPESGQMKYRNSVDVEAIQLNAIFINNFMRTVAMFGSKYWEAVELVMNGKGWKAGLSKIT